MHNQIFTNGNWNLLPDLGRTAVVAPCNIMRGFLPYARFPEVMGKFSSQRKSARLIRELKESAGHHFYASKMSVQNESIPMIYDYIISKLDNPKDKDAACQDAAKLLFDFNLTMDQFKENVMGLLVSEKKLKLFDNIETAVKTHFTKTFNSLN